MPHWYHKATWSALRSTYGPRLLERYRVRTESIDPEPREPYILVANHAHEADPWILGAVLTRTIRFMANLEGSGPVKAALAELVGAYGKRKGTADIAALKRTLELAKSRETLGLFPEGDRSWDGQFQGLKPGTGKFIKKLAMPVLMARNEGSYLSGPRWSRERRYGSWLIRFRVLSPDELHRLSPADLEQTICSWIGVDQLEINHSPFSCSAPAEGVERILWFCIGCGGIHSMRSEGSALLCTACGRVWSMRADCCLTPLGSQSSDCPGTLRSWLNRQKQELARRIAAMDTDWETASTPLVQDEAKLWRWQGRRREYVGKRVLSLFAVGVEIREPWSLDEIAQRRLPIADFVDHFNHFVEFTADKVRYRAVFEKPAAYKWIQTLEALKIAQGAAS